MEADSSGGQSSPRAVALRGRKEYEIYIYISNELISNRIKFV
jgi:hypothetical protein